eukprot:1337773-Rhodomonas_salina.2
MFKHGSAIPLQMSKGSSKAAAATAWRGSRKHPRKAVHSRKYNRRACENNRQQPSKGAPQAKAISPADQRRFPAS